MLRFVSTLFGRRDDVPSVDENDIPLNDMGSEVLVDDAWVMLNTLSFDHLCQQKKMPAVISTTSLLEACEKHFVMGSSSGGRGRGSYDARFVAATARKMIKSYCKTDDPYNPSALFDVIIVGAYVYALAQNDLWFSTNESPIALRALKSCCGFPPGVSVNGSGDDAAKFYMQIILTIGYKCLIEQLLPFDGKLLNCVDAFSRVMPKNRFDRYQLNRDGQLNEQMYHEGENLHLRRDLCDLKVLGESWTEINQWRVNMRNLDVDPAAEIARFLAQIDVTKSRFKDGRLACKGLPETSLYDKIMKAVDSPSVVMARR